MMGADRRSVFARIYIECGPQVNDEARKKLGLRLGQYVADVAQETFAEFLKLYEDDKVRCLQGDAPLLDEETLRQVRAFLQTILHRKFCKLLGRAVRNREQLDDLKAVEQARERATQDQGDLCDQAIRAEVQQRVRDAIRRIPNENHGQVVWLHHIEARPVIEIAALLNIPLGTVKTQLHRGRVALREILKDDDSNPLEE